MNLLQTIPPAVRTALYWTGYVVGVISQGVTAVWGILAASSPDVSMPLWLVIASAILGFLQTQLNLLAGSNVTPAPNTATVVAPENVAIIPTGDVDEPAEPVFEDREEGLS